MLQRANEAQSFSIPGGTEGILYADHPNKEQTIARVTMDGVYPQQGASVNATCTETLYVLEGELTLTVDDETVTLFPGDLYMVLPGQVYRCRGKATVLDVITPAWDKAQNRIVDEAS